MAEKLTWNYIGPMGYRATYHGYHYRYDSLAEKLLLEDAGNMVLEECVMGCEDASAAVRRHLANLAAGD